MFCYFLCLMLYMMALLRRVGAETRLQRVTAGWWNQLMYKHWTLKLWSYVLNSEVSTNGVFLYDVSSMSRLVVRRCLADSVLASSSAGRCDVPETRRRLLRTCARHCLLWICLTYLLWLIYVFSFAFWSILGVDSSGTFRSHVCLAVLARNCFKCSSRFL